MKPFRIIEKARFLIKRKRPVKPISIEKIPVQTPSFEECIRHFPTEETVRLQNNAVVVLKPFKEKLELRFVAFPSPEELKRNPELIALQRTGNFDLKEYLKGGFGYITVGYLNRGIEIDLQMKGFEIKQPAFCVFNIQMRNPFVSKEMPRHLRRRYWHVDRVLLERFEATAKKAGIKTIVVAQEREIPHTQREKIYKSLLGKNGYFFVGKSRPTFREYWVKFF